MKIFARRDECQKEIGVVLHIQRLLIAAVFALVPISAYANVFYDRDLLRSAPFEVFERALKDGVSAFSWASDAGGRSPLHFAALYDRFDLVDLLLEYGADINASTIDGCGPIHSAAIQGSSDMMKYLIELGADLDSARCSLLDFSMSSLNEFDVIEKTQIAVAAGANFSMTFRDGTNPYTKATMNTTYGADLIRLLVDLNHDVGLPSGGVVAAHAVKNLNVKVLEYLMGSFPNEVVKNSSQFPLMFYLIEAQIYSDRGEQRRFDMILFLLNSGLDIDAVDAAGRTLLHLVAAGDDSRFLQDMVDLGANPVILDRGGQSALEIASRGSLVGHPAYYAL